MELLFFIAGGLFVSAFYLGREGYSGSMEKEKRQNIAVWLFLAGCVALGIAAL